MIYFDEAGAYKNYISTGEDPEKYRGGGLGRHNIVFIETPNILNICTYYQGWIS